MVFITSFIGAAALLSGCASALPRPDSAINEPAVSAPNGIPITASSSPIPKATPASDMSNYGSSYGSSGSSGSNYGSSGSSYGSMDSSYGSKDTGSGSSGYGSGGNSGSSAVWTSSAERAASTSSAWQSYSTPSYGSGSSNWGNQGYNDCVQQCVASYGIPPAAYTPTATNPGTGNQGSGATHTVIVAPTQGVLRYIPFAVNASVGDTVKFMWGANNHTVTKSSSLLPCNKSSDALFASGTQNKDFVFTQVVNDTSPTFFYCATPGHCTKGMFGIINPPNAFQAPSSVSQMIPSLAANNSDVMAYASYTEAQTGKTSAGNWGNNIDMGALPDWSHQYVAENVMYTRNFLAANAEVLRDDGSVDLSAAGTTPLMIPQDLSVALSNAGSSSPSSPVAAPPAATTSDVPTSSPASALNSGALSMSSSKVLVGLVAALASFLMM